MARFMEKFAVCKYLDPAGRKSVPAEVYAKLPRHNFIDGHRGTKLKQLGIRRRTHAATRPSTGGHTST